MFEDYLLELAGLLLDDRVIVVVVEQKIVVVIYHKLDGSMSNPISYFIIYIYINF